MSRYLHLLLCLLLPTFIMAQPENEPYNKAETPYSSILRQKVTDVIDPQAGVDFSIENELPVPPTALDDNDFTIGLSSKDLSTSTGILEGEMLSIGNIRGSQGREVLVPVTATGFTQGLSSFQGVLQIGDPNVIQIQGIEGGLIGDEINLNLETNAMSFFSLVPGSPFGNSTVLFNIRVLVNGPITSTSTIDIVGTDQFNLEFFDNSVTQITPTIESGAVTSSGPTIIVGKVEGTPGDTVFLPVIGENLFANIVSAQGVIQVVDGSVGQILGIQNKILGGLINPANGFFSFLASDPFNPPFIGASDTLFCIRILLTGENGDSSDVLISEEASIPFQIGILDGNQVSTLDTDLQPGQIIIRSDVELAGQINTHWGTPMEDVLVDIAVDDQGNASQRTTRTDENGQYSLTEVPIDANLVITPERDTNSVNGITAIGLFAAQRFILALDIPQINSPYQIMAGDANCDGIMTTLDLIIIQRVQVRLNETFQAGCPSWRFIPVEEDPNFQLSTIYHVDYPSLQSSTTLEAIQDNGSADFRGVKVGDILNSANPAGFQETQRIQLTPDKESGTLELIAQPRYNANMGLLSYDLILPNDVAAVSYQFSMAFDRQNMRFAGAEAGITKPLVGGDEMGHLNISWFSADGEAVDGRSGNTMFSLQFEVANMDNLSSNALQIIDNGLPITMHDNNLFPLDIKLKSTQTTSVTDLSGLNQQVELYQNQPNPFSQQTRIGFYLPQSMEAELMIRDALGKVIWRKIATYGAGDHNETIDLNLPSGMYSYTLRTNGTTKTKTMIVNR